MMVRSTYTYTRCGLNGMSAKGLGSLLLVVASTFAANVVPLLNPVVEGDDESHLPLATTLSCIWSASTVTWSHAGTVLGPPKYSIQQNVSVYNDTTYGTLLLIQMLSYTDAGKYACVIQPSRPNGIESHSATIQLILIVKVEVLGSTNITVNATTTSQVELSCEMSQYIHPDGDLWWFRGGQRLDTTQSKYSVVYRNGTKRAQNGGSVQTSSRVSVLTISQLTSSDSGVYTCRLSGTDQSGDVTVMVVGSVRANDTMTSGDTLPGYVTPLVGVVTALLGVVIAVVIAMVIVTLWSQCCHMHKSLANNATPTDDAPPDNECFLEEPQPYEPQPYLSPRNDCTPLLGTTLSLGTADVTGPQSIHSGRTGAFSSANLQDNITFDPDYDQIYSEALDPAMLTHDYDVASVNDVAIPYSAIYEEPKEPLGYSSSVVKVTRKNVIEICNLGMGQFGQVILARTVGVHLMELQQTESDPDPNGGTLVAIKKLKQDAENGLVEAFDKEVKFMSRLKHDNVVRLLGVCTEGESFIMMEYMENGDLNQFLQKQKVMPDTISGLKENEVTPIILLYMGVQIASGMHYLSSRRFVHRDLATRNCLVGRDFVVKISDFGMSRSLYESAYYRVQGTLILPIRWMACETFYGKFSVKSDSWAFGVSMWEIYTLGKVDPYEEMTDEEVIADAIRGPDRKLLPRPDLCPQEVYDVMLRCWTHDPMLRWSFDEIHTQLCAAL